MDRRSFLTSLLCAPALVRVSSLEFGVPVLYPRGPGEIFLLKHKPLPMVGLWSQLTPEQQKYVLSYDGPEVLGHGLS